MLRRHRPMVWRLCLQHSRGEKERCRDLMQEVCIALWLHFGQLRPDASPLEERAWVRWQCRSALDLLRRKEHLTLHPLPTGIEETLPADSGTEQREAVDELLSALKPDEQRLMRLQLDGYPTDEIARLMGIGTGTVYQRVYRAMAKLRRVALLAAALVAVTAVALAVVPQWRQMLFGRQDTVPCDTIEISPKVEEMTPPDTVPKPTRAVPPPSPRRRLEPLEYLQPATPDEAATLQPSPMHSPVTIRLDGMKLTVSGLYGVRVTLRAPGGAMVASQVCHGACSFRLFPNDHSIYRTYNYQLQIGDSLIYDVSI